MFTLFKKNKETGNKKKVVASPAVKDCNSDPDCPMCHVSTEVVEQLKNKEGDSTTKPDS